MNTLKYAYRGLFSGAVSLLVSVLLFKAQVLVALAIVGGIAAGLATLPLFNLLVRDRIDWV